VRIEIFKAMKIQGKAGGSKILRNVGILPCHYTVS